MGFWEILRGFIEEWKFFPKILGELGLLLHEKVKWEIIS